MNYPNYKMTAEEFIKFVKQHESMYICYCEVIIDEDGFVHSAIPSHSEKVISLVCDRYTKTRSEIVKTIPIEETLLNYLANNCGYCIVWYDMVNIPVFGLTHEQESTLKMLIDNHVVRFGMDVLRNDIWYGSMHLNMSLYRSNLNCYDSLIIPRIISSIINNIKELRNIGNHKLNYNVCIISINDNQHIYRQCQIIDEFNPLYNHMADSKLYNHDLIIELKVNRFDSVIKTVYEYFAIAKPVGITINSDNICVFYDNIFDTIVHINCNTNEVKEFPRNVKVASTTLSFTI